MSGKPTGLNILAMIHPSVRPATAGNPRRKGNGVRDSLSLIWIQEYPREPRMTVRVAYDDAIMDVAAILKAKFFALILCIRRYLVS